MSESIYEEDIVLWTIISADNFNISYSEAKEMSPNERLMIFYALSAINKRRNKTKK